MRILPDEVSVAVGAFAFRVVKDNLAHAHALGRYFHVFVFTDIFQGFFQREDGGRHDAGLLSEPEARMLVSCLLLVTFTTKSFSWMCSPTICPA